MLKELICAVALSGTIGITAPQNSNDGTYYQDVTITETYEYETNEVNSVDDLIVGNIYKYNVPLDTPLSNVIVYASFIRTHGNYLITLDNTGDFSRITLSKLANDTWWQFVCYNTDYSKAIYLPYDSVENTTQIEFYFVYVNSSSLTNANYISASDYLGEKTITITPKEFNGLFSIFDNFLHERLFSGGILDTTNVTVFNATMSLGQWLSTTTSIVLLSLIVLLLVLLIKFIFKYVGGMMIWRS